VVSRHRLHLMGRATYQEMAEFWPASNDAYAAPMNDIPKVVFSQTLERADWPESRIARGNLAAEITALKREPGKDMIAWGGAAFAQSLKQARARRRIPPHPSTGGRSGGASAVQDLKAALRLELVDTTTYSTGATLNSLRPASLTTDWTTADQIAALDHGSASGPFDSEFALSGRANACELRNRDTRTWTH